MNPLGKTLQQMDSFTREKISRDPFLEFTIVPGTRPMKVWVIDNAALFRTEIYEKTSQIPKGEARNVFTILWM